MIAALKELDHPESFFRAGQPGGTADAHVSHDAVFADDECPCVLGETLYSLEILCRVCDKRKIDLSPAAGKGTLHPQQCSATHCAAFSNTRYEVCNGHHPKPVVWERSIFDDKRIPVYNPG
ncbi:hypothetical protein PROFUN_11638 [Planoprotostelium fungivorum]|uniref:Uncharacterized protein n=1 Tax=Planoprotostelium fungivorum TaxID=1890364 RepID=A0A2P6N9R5_9EUKA|nr:hypothetical protein PROFUN_11638 [Planoprotostelium fungivorum]